jgi:hypothetical protein
VYFESNKWNIKKVLLAHHDKNQTPQPVVRLPTHCFHTVKKSGFFYKLRLLEKKVSRGIYGPREKKLLEAGKLLNVKLYDLHSSLSGVRITK